VAEHPVIYEMDNAHNACPGDEIAAMAAAAKVLLEHAIGRSNTFQSDMTTPELWLRSFAQDLGIELEDE
jgi:hypothetical protein